MNPQAVISRIEAGVLSLESMSTTKLHELLQIANAELKDMIGHELMYR